MNHHNPNLAYFLVGLNGGFGIIDVVLYFRTGQPSWLLFAGMCAAGAWLIWPRSPAA